MCSHDSEGSWQVRLRAEGGVPISDKNPNSGNWVPQKIKIL